MRRMLILSSISCLVLAGQLTGCAGTPPSHFMQGADQLTPCSSAPHCVSSQAAPDSPHHIAPLTYSGRADAARQALVEAILASDNATVEKTAGRFIHATFESTLGFVDDVTAIVQPEHKIIDIKSASRLGYYDFGVNRQRVETLRKRFNASLDAG